MLVFEAAFSSPKDLVDSVALVEMAQRGVDYESLPGSLGSTPKHPLSRSLSRPSSPLRPMSDRGPQSPSLHNQAVLRNCRDQNPDFFLPQQPQSPTLKKTAFSLHTTPTSDYPPPPSPPVPKSKFLSRSLTFSPSLGSKVGRNLHCPDNSTSSDLPSPSKPSAESSSSSSSSENDLKAQPRDLKNPTPSQADGPAAAAVFVKSLFRSSTFASRDSKPDQNASSSSTSATRSGMYSSSSTPAEPAKSFFRSSSFAHKDPGFSIAKSLSRSFSSLSSHDQQEQAHEPSSLSGFSKWARSFRSKPATTAEPVVEIPESSPYSLFSGSPSASSSSKRASSRVFPTEELENSFGVLTKGFLDSSKNAVKAVQDKARHLVSQRNQVC